MVAMKVVPTSSDSSHPRLSLIRHILRLQPVCLFSSSEVPYSQPEAPEKSSPVWIESPCAALALIQIEIHVERAMCNLGDNSPLHTEALVLVPYSASMDLPHTEDSGPHVVQNQGVASEKPRTQVHTVRHTVRFHRRLGYNDPCSVLDRRGPGDDRTDMDG